MDLQAFAGPLDLLLFLIKRHELDIFDIPIAFMCSQYVACLDATANLSLDVAAEFLAMAAELMLIKSKVLLPPEPSAEDDEDAEVGDPRAELVERLLEYQKFQVAAQELGDRDRLGRDVFAASPSAGEVVTPHSPRLKQASVFTLVHAFNAILKRHRPQERHRVVVEQVSVHKRMHAVVGMLAEHQLLSFAALFVGVTDRLDVIVNFLSVLELTRMKLLRLLEDDAGALMLQARFDLAEEAYDRLQGSQPDFQ